MSSRISIQSKVTGEGSFQDPLFSNQNRQELLLESLAGAVYTCDSNGYITFYNKAAAELWGRSPVIGKDIWCGSWKIFEPDGITRVPLDKCPMAIALKEGRSVRGVDIVVQRPDGIKRNIMPFPDAILDQNGKVVEGINMLVDITDIKLKEKELRKSKDQYKALSEQLKAALKTQEEFISIASHELKTPLTSLNLFIQILLDRYAEQEDDNTYHIVSRSKVQVNRLRGLLRQLLDVTKIQAGMLDLEFEEVNLSRLLEDTIQDHSAVISKHKIIKKGGSTTLIQCDRNRIEQVLSNLLTNAAKYSDYADTIMVSIIEDEDIMQVDVQDFGIGIPKKDLKKVFNRFFRSHGADKGMLSSLGLGLYICANIIKRHHGKIWVDSVEGKGSTFHVQLPKTLK